MDVFGGGRGAAAFLERYFAKDLPVQLLTKLLSATRAVMNVETQHHSPALGAESSTAPKTVRLS